MGPRSEGRELEVRSEMLGAYPCLVAGSGAPLVILTGLYPEAGISTKGLGKTHIATLTPWAQEREVFYLNRRPALPIGMTISELAAEHADALRSTFAAPVDVLGMSTGGSIAQQLAAEHPDVVRRLVLVSTGARLIGVAKLDQRRVAARVRAGSIRRAGAVFGSAMAPQPRGVTGLLAGVAGWVLTPRLFSTQGLEDMATTIEAEDDFDLGSLPAIQAPTLLVGGGQDPFYPRELLDETISLIPGARLEFRSDAGHVSVLAKPGVIATVLEFMSAPLPQTAPA